MCAFEGDVKVIAGGGYHSIVLKNNGKVLTTGRNDWGQLGDDTSVDKNRFVFVIGTWAIALGNTLTTCTDLPVANASPRPPILFPMERWPQHYLVGWAWGLGLG